MYINTDLYMSNVHNHIFSLVTLGLPKYNNGKRTAINENFVHSIWSYITKNYQHRCYPYLWVTTSAKTNAMYYLIFSPNCKCQKKWLLLGLEKKHTSGKNRGCCSWGNKPTRQSLVCSDFQINSEWHNMAWDLRALSVAHLLSSQRQTHHKL